MTSANTADGRKTLLSVGSTPLMIPVAKPIANPPSVAVRPVDAAHDDADKDDDRLAQGEVGSHEGELDGEDDRDRRSEQAREEDGEADHPVGADAEQPGGLEVGGGGAHVQPDRRPHEQQREQGQRDGRDDHRGDRDLADVDARDRRRLVERCDRRRDLADRVVADVDQSAIAWSMKAMAKVVTSMTAGDWPRSGRKTTRSISIDSATTTDEARGDARRDRPRRREGEV